MNYNSNKIKLSDIINTISSYHYFVYKDNKVVSYHTNNMLNFDNVKKRNGDSIIVVLLKPITKKENELNKFTQFKLIGGPLYGLIHEYSMENNSIKKMKTKIKNKVYFPKKYLVKYWKKNDTKHIVKDIKKMASAYREDKLKQQLFAVNTILNLD